MSCVIYNVRNLERFGQTGTDAIIFEHKYGPTVSAAKDGLVIYYAARTTRSGGEYFAVGRIGDLLPHPGSSGHLMALVTEYGTFPANVRAFGEGHDYEHSLFGYNWRSMVMRTIRPIPDDQALAILGDASPVSSPAAGFSEPEHSAYLPFRGVETFTRLSRWLGLRHRCLAVYDYRCSFTGTGLRDGRGNFEVDCCHVRPVADGGPDTISNTVLLNKTMHWAYDHFLVSLEDDFRFLVSDHLDPRYKVSLNESGFARVPADPDFRPAVGYLRWHRAKFEDARR